MNTRWMRTAALTGLGLAATTIPGCFIGEMAGLMAESARRQGSEVVEPEYRGLQGKSFAVVVMADRIVQSDHPEVVAKVTTEVAARLAKECGASAFVPGQDVLQYTFNHPRWSTRPPGELAKELGVQRLVVIELTEYRLVDPGNQYVWQGVATATVGVIEADSMTPDEISYQKQVRVKFPTKGGYGPADLPGAAVNTELTRRIIDRTSWLFYAHSESNIIEY